MHALVVNNSPFQAPILTTLNYIYGHYFSVYRVRSMFFLGGLSSFILFVDLPALALLKSFV